MIVILEVKGTLDFTCLSNGEEGKASDRDFKCSSIHAMTGLYTPSAF